LFLLSILLGLFIGRFLSVDGMENESVKNLAFSKYAGLDQPLIGVIVMYLTNGD
jgi:hypothetical protein